MAIDDLDDAIELNERRGTSRVARFLVLLWLNKEDDARDDIEAALGLGDVEVELFIREYCIAPAMQQRALALFEVGPGSGRGRRFWQHRSASTH